MRLRTRARLLAVALLVASRLAVAESPKPTKELLAQGKELYRDKCAVCHGTKGDGRGDAAYLLYPRPRDFTMPRFKIRSTPTGSLPLDEDLFRTISQGMAGTAMPPWQDELSDRQRWALAHFIKAFSDRWKDSKADPPIPLGPELPQTERLLSMGKQVYERMECAKCHGEQGKGDGPSSAEMTDTDEMPIVPYDFTVPGRFKGGSAPRDIVRSFLTGLDGTPMPAYKGNMSNEEAWALAYYVRAMSPSEKSPPRPGGNTIISQRHNGELPLNSFHSAWRKAISVEIPVRLLWIRKQSIETVQVRALHNDRELAFLIEWDDPISNASHARPQDFRDAVAVQFALAPPVVKSGKPFYGMGAHDTPVNIWHWKADWQIEVDQQRETAVQTKVASDDDPLRSDDPLFLTGRAAGNPGSQMIRKSPVEDLNATGLSTITSQPPESQNVAGKGVWEGEKWHVVFRRALDTGDPRDVQLQHGGRVPIAFAVWDGAAFDRGGQKAVTPWQTLELPVVPRHAPTLRQSTIAALLLCAAGCFGFVAFNAWRRA